MAPGFHASEPVSADKPDVLADARRAVHNAESQLEFFWARERAAAQDLEGAQTHLRRTA